MRSGGGVRVGRMHERRAGWLGPGALAWAAGGGVAPRFVAEWRNREDVAMLKVVVSAPTHRERGREYSWEGDLTAVASVVLYVEGGFGGEGGGKVGAQWN